MNKLLLKINDKKLLTHFYMQGFIDSNDLKILSSAYKKYNGDNLDDFLRLPSDVKKMYFFCALNHDINDKHNF
jgi:hypothetical protein